MGAFVNDESVRALKLRLAPQFDATDRSVDACAALASDDRAAWKLFHASWSVYRAAPESYWWAASQYTEGERFEQQLAAWQDKLSGQCKLSTPRVKLPDEPPVVSAVKWVAIAVGLGAAAYALRTVFR